MYMCQFQSPNSSHPTYLPFGVHTFVLYVCVSISALQIRSSIPFFKIPHICVITKLLFSYWLTSLCMTLSGSINVSTNDPVSFLFMAEWRESTLNNNLLDDTWFWRHISSVKFSWTWSPTSQGELPTPSSVSTFTGYLPLLCTKCTTQYL